MDTGESWLLYKALCKRKLRFSLWFQYVALKCSRLFKDLLLPIPQYLLKNSNYLLFRKLSFRVLNFRNVVLYFKKSRIMHI